MEKEIKVRIAPSPTGDPHVGTAYIGLFNYAFAKKNNGKFVLRIEDTDRTRYSETSEQQIFDAMHWLGLDYDEGPDVGGNYGPYRQSERFDLYRKYAEELVEKGMAYYCFATSEELEKMRERQKALGQAPMYDGRSRNLSQEEVQRRLKNNEPYVIRLKMPYDGVTIVKDELRGEIPFDNDKIDDQILLKSDGYPTYHLANIVDDHLMGITHVIRAEEWITSTPKHVQLYKAFGWDCPKFYHMPLLRNKDKTKISKRKNPVSLNYYREEGYLKEAILNFLALMGWSLPPEDENGVSKEIFTIDEMIQKFDFSRISLGGPVFDLVKLDWLNNQHMRLKNISELTDMAMPFLEKEGYNLNISREKLEKIVDIIRVSAHTLHELAKDARVFFDDNVIFEKETEDMNTKERKSLSRMYDALNHEKSNKILELFVLKLDTLTEEISEEKASKLIHDIMDELEEGPAVVMMNLRGRLTGKPRGVDLGSLISVLGKTRVLMRINE